MCTAPSPRHGSSFEVLSPQQAPLGTHAGWRGRLGAAGQVAAAAPHASSHWQSPEVVPGLERGGETEGGPQGASRV